MNKGIAVAGNMIVDIIYPIQQYPSIGTLTSIEDNIVKATGGLVCNNIIDLAKLDNELPLYALGVIGQDEYGSFILDTLKQFPNINLKGVKFEGRTSFTAVMSEKKSKQRTFFHYRGANALFSEKHINMDELDVDILHIGYLLLLDELDKEDEKFGTKLARLLAHAKQKGIRTSIDVVSEEGKPYQKTVLPALKYTDYCTINEFEAEATTGIQLRNETGIITANMVKALYILKQAGVSKWAIIHCPEGGFGLDCELDQYCEVESIKLPKGYIKGTNGAGDAYCSGILYSAYNGWALPKALETGTACAVSSLSSESATQGLSSIDEVLERYRAFIN